MTATHSERERFVASLIRYAPKSEASHAQRLMRFAKTYAKLNQEPAKNYLKLAQVRVSVYAVCFRIGIKALFCEELHIGVDDGLAMKIIKVPQI